MKYIIIYLVVICFFSVVFCCADKYLAENNGWRISEKTLFVLSILGGSLPMFVTMLVIRHKIRKKRFMLGLPLIFILQIAVVTVYKMYL